MDTFALTEISCQWASNLRLSRISYCLWYHKFQRAKQQLLKTKAMWALCIYDRLVTSFVSGTAESQ